SLVGLLARLAEVPDGARGQGARDDDRGQGERIDHEGSLEPAHERCPRLTLGAGAGNVTLRGGARVSDAAAVAVAVEPHKSPPAPRFWVVLPTASYGLLVPDAVGLAVLHFKVPERSASHGYTYIFGWIGLASMTVMHVYSLRRRLKAFRGLGKIRYWLHFHI